MSSSQDRVKGVLLGLAAGDRIGGPINMAIRFAESLSECRRFDKDDLLARYLAWWREDAFDTGPTTATVLDLVDDGLNINEAARIVHERAGGMTGGCNPTHRCTPLAMAAFLPDDDLTDHACSQARLTHLDPVAGEVSSLATHLCRALIRGTPWDEAVQQLRAKLLSAQTVGIFDPTSNSALSRDGFAPEVLRAAIWFTSQHSSFAAALTASISFAGPANYCPVLVGAIAGARWGARMIPAELLQDCEILGRAQAAANSLANDWN